jgi:hypothetical protein
MNKNNELARLLELFSALLPLSKTERAAYLAQHSTASIAMNQTMQLLESERENTELPSINKLLTYSPATASEMAEAGD